MTALAHAPGRLISPAAAERLFDELIYDRIVELVDLDGLYLLQCFLSDELDRLGCDAKETSAIAQAMVDRALQRLAADDKRYDRIGICDCDCERECSEGS